MLVFLDLLCSHRTEAEKRKENVHAGGECIDFIDECRPEGSWALNWMG